MSGLINRRRVTLGREQGRDMADQLVQCEHVRHNTTEHVMKHFIEET
jgi:hypothetical protein